MSSLKMGIASKSDTPKKPQTAVMRNEGSPQVYPLLLLRNKQVLLYTSGKVPSNPSANLTNSDLLCFARDCTYALGLRV